MRRRLGLLCVVVLAMSVLAPAVGVARPTVGEPVTTYEWRKLWQSDNASFAGLSYNDEGLPYGVWSIDKGGQHFVWGTHYFSSGYLFLPDFNLASATDARIDFTASWSLGVKYNNIFVKGDDPLLLATYTFETLTPLSGSRSFQVNCSELAGRPIASPYLNIYVNSSIYRGEYSAGQATFKNISFWAYVPVVTPPPPPPADADTVITISVPSSCPKYGPIEVNGSLKTAAGVPLAGREVWLDGGLPIIGSEGGTWDPLQSMTTDAAGFFRATIEPIRSAWLRARFAAQTGYNASTSSIRKLTVIAPTPPTVYAPHAPTSAHHGSSFTVWGYLKPRHTAGSYAITLYCYRYQSGHYVLRKSVVVKVSNYSSYSKYSGKVSLPYAGKWRIKAGHLDAGLNEKFSGYDYVRAY